MNFYEEIVHRLYLRNTIIGVTQLQWKDFIEAMQNKSDYKGVTYYSNIIDAMPKHFGASLYPSIFKETLQYCKEKIDLINAPVADTEPLTIETDVPKWTDLIEPLLIGTRLKEVEDKAIKTEHA